MMAKKGEWQLKLQAILDLCRDNYGWSRDEVAKNVGYGRHTFTDVIHREGGKTAKRAYYACYGLVAEYEIKKKKGAKNGGAD